MEKARNRILTHESKALYLESESVFFFLNWTSIVAE